MLHGQLVFIHTEEREISNLRPMKSDQYLGYITSANTKGTKLVFHGLDKPRITRSLALRDLKILGESPLCLCSPLSHHLGSEFRIPVNSLPREIVECNESRR